MKAMNIFLKRIKVRGRAYYQLCTNLWDTKKKAVKQVYLASAGRHKTISLEKAREIAKKIGCSLDDLRAVNGLRIVDGSQGAKRVVKRS
jgi:hypothetical protein